MAMFLKEPKANQLDYAGSWCPSKGLYATYNQSTFSVGIFQWLPKSSGKGLKKSAVIKRIRGYTSNPEQVYNDAKAWIEKNSDHAGCYREQIKQA